LQKIQELIRDKTVSGLVAQKNNLFLWIPFFFAVGIAIYFSLKIEPPITLATVLLVIVISVTFGAFKAQYRSHLLKALFLVLVALTIILLGFLTAQVRTNLVHTPMLLKKMMPVGVEGTIESIEPLSAKDGSRVILKDLRIERLSRDKTPRKIRIKIRKDKDIQAGQRVKFLAGLNPPSPPVAPHAFDFQRMAYFKGIGAVGFAYNAPEVLEGRDSGAKIANIRHKIAEKIQEVTIEPQSSVLIALMTGQRGAIEEADKEALRGAGLAHLLAISGLHVGMVAGVIFFFSRLILAGFPMLALKYPIKKWAAAIALIGAFFYTLTVGGTIPTQRALIMTGLMMVAIMFDRSPFSLRLVALAAFVVLLFAPESLTSVSFQMSFSAVVALICFYDWMRPFWLSAHRQAGICRKAALYFAGVLITTLIAGAATGLFALFHFQQYAHYGVLGNLVAVPLMAFVVMPLIVLSYVTMPIGLGALPLAGAEWGVGWILAAAHWVNNMEGAVLHMASWPHWIFIVMVIISWIFCVWIGRIKWLLLPVFVFLTALVFMYRQPDILVASKVDLVAIQNQDKELWFSTGRKERFTADNLLRLNGDEGQKKNIWPREGSATGFPLNCDVYGCRGEIRGQRVSVAFSNKAWQEDCSWADIIIAKTPVPYKECAAGTIIDFFDVWREGPHAIWLNRNDVKIKTVEEIRGLRPWTQTSANARKKL
jgi:competence protein ComEC